MEVSFTLVMTESYVIKTMSPEEFVFFKKILPDYFNYIYAEPGSLIPKIFRVSQYQILFRG